MFARLFFSSMTLIAITWETQAAPITFYYTGVIVGGGEYVSPADPTIVIPDGTTFSGYYQFDSDMPDTFPDPDVFQRDNTRGVYTSDPFFDPITGETLDFRNVTEIFLSIDVPTYQFGALEFKVQGSIRFQISPNNYDVTGGVRYGGMDASSLLLGELDDFLIGLGTASNNTVFPNDSLPVSPPDLALFESNNFSFTSEQLGLAGIPGRITSLESQAVVPVPAAVWLFGSGIICLIGIARRKKL